MNRNQRRAGGGGSTSGGKHAAELKMAREMLRNGFAAEAGNLYRQILQEDPDNVGALLDLGIAAIERQDIDAAAPYMTRVAALEPKNPWALVGLAVVKAEQNDMPAALGIADKALRLDCPPPVLVKFGVLYKEAGRLDRARQCLRQALVKNPELVMAWYNLQDMKTFGPGDTDIARLQALAAKSAALPLQDQIYVEFSLGKALIDSGDADAGFAHVAKGNALKHGTYKYDITLFEEYIDKVIGLFTAETVQRLRGKGSVTHERPVFIVGMLRSGSTLADQILSSHPEVKSVGEARILQQSIPVVANTEMRAEFFGDRFPSFSKAFMEQLTPATLDDIANKYLAATDPFAQGAARVVDKMLFNYMWIGLIRLALPGAKIIHCRRNLMDVGLSIWRTHFASSIPWAYDQAEIGRYMRGYERLMTHWHKLFPGEIYDLSYEALIADQEGQTRKLLAHCGLPWDPRCLDFHKAERRVSTASDVQVRQPLYGDSVLKWKRYEKHLTPLAAALRSAP